ncbi:hypothetical protein THAOC_26224, partial [Thalassiosira oceanica]
TGLGPAARLGVVHLPLEEDGVDVLLLGEDLGGAGAGRSATDHGNLVLHAESRRGVGRGVRDVLPHERAERGGRPDAEGGNSEPHGCCCWLLSSAVKKLAKMLFDGRDDPMELWIFGPALWWRGEDLPPAKQVDRAWQNLENASPEKWRHVYLDLDVAGGRKFRRHDDTCESLANHLRVLEKERGKTENASSPEKCRICDNATMFRAGPHASFLGFDSRTRQAYKKKTRLKQQLLFQSLCGYS